MAATIHIAAIGGAGDFAGYFATPPSAAAAGIVVVQEIFGINADVRALVDGWAAQGYAALAPDLFWRLEPGVELDAEVAEQREAAFALYSRFDVDAAVADIEASIKALRAHGCTRVGVVGHCLGGLLAYLAATRTDSDASVGYYGVGIDAKLNEAGAIAKPLMLHIATRDGFASPEAQAAVHNGLGGNPRVQLFDYDADHAFARASGTARVPALARIADDRTAAFFREHLAA